MTDQVNIPNHVLLDSVTFRVFGTYAHGKLKGKTNPNPAYSVEMRLFAEEDGGQVMKDFIGRLRGMTGDAFFQVIDAVRVESKNPSISMSMFLNKEHYEEALAAEAAE